MLDNVKELIDVSRNLGIEISLLKEKEAQRYIETVLALYKPFKTQGHLGIGKDTVSLPIEKYEFTYSQYLKEESAYIFFDQYSNIGRKSVVKVNNAKIIGELFENTFGMEYFVSNKAMNYLIAVNWYVVEIAGTAKQYLLPLYN